MFLFAFQLAIDYGIKFLETSAKSSTNVEEVRKKYLVTYYGVTLELRCLCSSSSPRLVIFLVSAFCELHLPFVNFCASDFYADPSSWISSTQPPHGLCEIAQLRFTVQKVEVPFKFSFALCLGSQKCCTRWPSTVFSAHLSWFMSSYSSP